MVLSEQPMVQILQNQLGRTTRMVSRSLLESGTFLEMLMINRVNDQWSGRGVSCSTYGRSYRFFSSFATIFEVPVTVQAPLAVEVKLLELQSVRLAIQAEKIQLDAKIRLYSLRS
jgi:hypothetical protein